MSLPEQPQPVSYVITLVHGTFGRKSEWTDAVSDFSLGLKNALKYDVEVKSIKWSGKNSSRERFSGWSKIDAGLYTIMADHPKSLHFVVAHSHGGNVVRYAMREGYQCRKLAGYITLGTPFISCSPRDLEWTINRVFMIFGIVLLAVINPVIWKIVSILVDMDRVIDWLANYAWGVPAFFLLFAGAGFSIAILLPRILYALFRKFHRYAQRLQSNTRLRLEDIPDAVPLLCFTAIDDEAGTLLTGWRLFANLPNQLLGYLLKILPAVLIIVGAVVFIPLIFGSRGIDEMSPAATIIVRLGEYCSLAVPLLIFFAALMPWLTRARGFGFGGESIADNLFSDIAATPTPIGVRCPTMAINDLVGRGIPQWIPGRNHSSFFYSEKVRTEIAQWIGEIAKTKATPLG